MKRLLRLVEVTPEGRIVAALFEGAKSYGELKSATGLSDRWIAKKLKELSSAEIVEHYEGRYQLRKPAEVMESDPVFAEFLRRRVSPGVKASLIAEELSQVEQVVAVILFGSVAKGAASEGSDVDLLIVTEREVEEQLNGLVYSLMFKYDVPVEAIFQTYDDLVINLHAKTAFSFGLLEGYDVLYDRGGVEFLLSMKRRELVEGWVYDGESGSWIQKKLTPTLKPPRTR